MIENSGSECELTFFFEEYLHLLNLIIFIEDLQNNTQILYTLNFVKQIIHEFHSSSLKSICECIFQLLTLNNIVSSVERT